MGLIPLIIEKYFIFYNEDFSKFKWLAIEKSFDIDFHGFKLRGKIDGVFEHKGKVWLLEHKTKGRIPDSVFQMLGFNFQNLLYITSFEQEFKTKVCGVQYNIIRNPQVKMTQKDKSFADFRNRISSAFDADPKYYFMRSEMFYSDEEKEKFKTDLLQRLNLIKYIRENDITFRNQSACETGSYTCKFIEYCSTGLLSQYSKEKLFPELEETGKETKSKPIKKGIKK
jgi:hypothetical protein